ncbi:MAG: hypothetical protein CBC83_08125 [Flavobacteriales bacterium TMED123]|nr:MAG: hypothetical protein CBC83_08125 [Flavobacteriales bacterium TMED123]
MANENTISTAFVEEFEAGIKLAYQRMGSKLRNTVRTRNSATKNKVTFQKAGKGAASQKARAGDIKPMNISHTNVNVTLEDWFAGEWIDDMDLLRVEHDEFMVAQQSGAAALGRKTDDQIIDACETTSSAANETTNGITLAYCMTMLENFGNNDVPDDGERFAIVAWENWTQLLSLDQFASQDYVPTDEMPLSEGTQAKKWLSFTWIPHSGLDSINSDADRRGLFYHRTAVGHAVGKDVSLNLQYYNTKDSHFSLAKMQMNAVLIDANGCFKADLKK